MGSSIDQIAAVVAGDLAGKVSQTSEVTPRHEEISPAREYNRVSHAFPVVGAMCDSGLGLS